MAAPGAAAERYVRASVNHAGSLEIVASDGRTIVIPKREEEIGFDKVAISPDGSAVGWVGRRENCCTSYPIPTRLEVYRAGERLTFAGNDLPVFTWKFVDGGRRVAFHQETVHGGHGVHFEIRDLTSGALIAMWEPEYGPDNRVRPNQKPPAWVRDLRK
jgi:hypothetical protein